MAKIPQTGTNFLLGVTVVCTILIILSQFILADRTERKFLQALQEMEYGKVGGEANYRFLREIQREQTESYIKDLESEQPEYAREVRAKYEGTGAALSGATLSPLQKGALTPHELEVLRRDAPVLGDSGATVSVMEFSDFACPYCREFHNAGTVRQVLQSYGTGANYFFKVIPDSKHENAVFLARSLKCVAQTGSGKTFFGMVDGIFAATGSTVDAAYAIALQAGIDKEKLDACVKASDTAELVEKDLGQGVYLRIRSTPSLLIVRNDSGKYAVLSGESAAATVKGRIDSLLGKTR
jgi:protein-disulfide isomerase